MSACRFVTAIVFERLRLQLMRMVMASTSILSEVGESHRDLGRNLAPYHHRVALRVGLGDDGQELARPALHQLEREPHYARHTGAGHQRDVDGRFLRRANESRVHRYIPTIAKVGVVALEVRPASWTSKAFHNLQCPDAELIVGRGRRKPARLPVRCRLPSRREARCSFSLDVNGQTRPPRPFRAGFSCR